MPTYLKLTEVLTKESIKVKVRVLDWKEAIRKAGELLLKKGAIEERYIDNMIKACSENNAYIVIAPGIALAHARPEDGVKQIGFSLLTLENPVWFGHPENDPVDIIIAFGATDNKSHLSLMAQLAELLSNNEKLQKIKNAKTVDEIIKVIEDPASQNSLSSLPHKSVGREKGYISPIP